jgi:hypothetical protein
MIEDDVVGRVARLAEFGEHDRLFPLQLVGVEVRRADQIGDHIEPEREIASEEAGVEDGVVARSPGVERAAGILDRLGNRARVAIARALEHHMLDHVGEARKSLGLRARTDIGIEADRDRLDAGHRLDRDGEPVRQAMEARGHAAGVALSAT